MGREYDIPLASRPFTNPLKSGQFSFCNQVMLPGDGTSLDEPMAKF